MVLVSVMLACMSERYIPGQMTLGNTPNLLVDYSSSGHTVQVAGQAVVVVVRPMMTPVVLTPTAWEQLLHTAAVLAGYYGQLAVCPCLCLCQQRQQVPVGPGKL